LSIGSDGGVGRAAWTGSGEARHPATRKFLLDEPMAVSYIISNKAVALGKGFRYLLRRFV